MITSNFYYNFYKANRFFKQSLQWNREQILIYQNQKVKEIVIHAGKNVPYYRNLFANIGLDLKTFRGFEDLGKIPYLDKDSIRKDPKSFLADNYQKYKGGWEKTSGSTGTPIKIWIDNISKAFKYAAVVRAFGPAGYRLFRKALIVKGFSESKSKPFGYLLSSNMLYFNASAADKRTFLDFYPLFCRFSPRIIIGYARTIAQMGQYIIDNRLKFPKIESIINYGQNMPPETIKFLSERFKCKIYDVYMNVENVVLIYNFKDYKFRIAEDYFFPEFLKGKNGNSDPGYSELIGTSFYNYAMPLIRYKTRDFIKVGQHNDDLGFRCVDKIIGRVDDYIVSPKGGHVYFAEGALGYAEGIVAGQYIQEEPDTLKILLIVDDYFKKEYFELIEKGLVKRLGNELKYEFVITDQLERNASGKVPFIINRLNN